MRKFTSQIPVRENEDYVVRVESIGEKGDGICKVDGFIVIVPNAKLNQEYLVKVTKVKSKFSFGMILEKIIKD